MKTSNSLFLKILPVLVFLLQLLTLDVSAAISTFISNSEVNDVLTIHQWILMEANQTVHDTTTNITLFRLPCEKDNYMKYEASGSYRISEGANNCNTNNNSIVGEGTWKYVQEDSSINDRYEGGGEIEKKILVINDEVLKLQWVGEGNVINTFTYFSESGIKNESNKDLIEDDADPAAYILKTIKENLLSTNRYVLITLKDFNNGNASLLDNKNGALPRVALIPLDNSTDKTHLVNTTERNSALMIQAKKAGVGYVITGNLIVSKAKKNKSGKFVGNIQYEIDILDIISGTINSKTFHYDESNDIDPQKIGGLIKDAGSVLGIGSLYLYRQAGWSSWYTYYFISNSSQALGSTATNIFSSVNKIERQENYQSSVAIIKATAHTEKDLDEFTIDNAPLKIIINNIQTEKKNTVLIESGSAIGLTQNEKLKVVKKNFVQMSNGSSTVETEILGEIKVIEVGAVLSKCTIVSGSKQILDNWNLSKSDVIALTLYKSNDH